MSGNVRSRGSGFPAGRGAYGDDGFQAGGGSMGATAADFVAGGLTASPNVERPSFISSN
jgi:hypothetical protein